MLFVVPHGNLELIRPDENMVTKPRTGKQYSINPASTAILSHTILCSTTTRMSSTPFPLGRGKPGYTTAVGRHREVKKAKMTTTNLKLPILLYNNKIHILNIPYDPTVHFSAVSTFMNIDGDEWVDVYRKRRVFKRRRKERRHCIVRSSRRGPARKKASFIGSSLPTLSPRLKDKRDINRRIREKGKTRRQKHATKHRPTHQHGGKRIGEADRPGPGAPPGNPHTYVACPSVPACLTKRFHFHTKTGGSGAPGGGEKEEGKSGAAARIGKKKMYYKCQAELGTCNQKNHYHVVSGGGGKTTAVELALRNEAEREQGEQDAQAQLEAEGEEEEKECQQHPQQTETFTNQEPTAPETSKSEEGDMDSSSELDHKHSEPTPPAAPEPPPVVKTDPPQVKPDEETQKEDQDEEEQETPGDTNEELEPWEREYTSDIQERLIFMQADPDLTYSERMSALLLCVSKVFSKETIEHTDGANPQADGMPELTTRIQMAFREQTFFWTHRVADKVSSSIKDAGYTHCEPRRVDVLAAKYFRTKISYLGCEAFLRDGLINVDTLPRLRVHFSRELHGTRFEGLIAQNMLFENTLYWLYNWAIIRNLHDTIMRGKLRRGRPHFRLRGRVREGLSDVTPFLSPMINAMWRNPSRTLVILMCCRESNTLLQPVRSFLIARFQRRITDIVLRLAHLYQTTASFMPRLGRIFRSAFFGFFRNVYLALRSIWR